MHIITVPLKIWRPKPVNRCIPLPPYSDIDDDLCLSSAYGLAIHRTKEKSPPPSTRDDFILWDKNIHFSHLQNHLHLRDDMDITVRDAILSVVKKTGMLLISKELVVLSLATSSTLTLVLHHPFVVSCHGIVFMNPRS